jgi:ABC-type glycerol-3-phosphate transport system substrate-binding protein
MRTRKKTWFTGGAAALSIVLLGGLLAGCSGSGNSQSKGGDDTSMSLTWMRYEHPSQAIVDDSKAVQEILKRQNVKLNLQSVPQSNYDDKKKTLIATNTIPDVILVKQDDIQNYSDTGVFLDLTSYLDKMPNFKKVLEDHPEVKNNYIDGKLFGFPLVTKWDLQAGQIPMIRMDLLKAQNLQVPTTYEELYETFKKLKEANPSSYPFASRAANGLTGTENLINPIAFGFGSGYTTSNGTKIYYDPATKRYEFGPYSDSFKEAMAWLHKLYSEKLLDQDYTTATSQTWQEKLNSGKSFYFQDNNGFGNTFNTILQQQNPDAKFDMIPVLASPSGVKRNLVYSLDHLSESYVISSKVKDPDKVIAFIDWMYGEEGTNLTSLGVENEDYKIENGEFKLTEETLNKYKDKPVPYYAMQSALGTGYLGLAIHYDDRPNIPFQSADALAWSDTNLKNVEAGINVRFTNDPPFNKEERERLKQLRTELDSFITSNMDKFIIKDGALESDWAAFVEQCKAKGADELVKIYNDALARVQS